MHKLHSHLPIETIGGNKVTVSDDEKLILLETIGGHKAEFSDQTQIITIEHSDGAAKIEVGPGGIINIIAGDVLLNGISLLEVIAKVDSLS